MGSHLNSLVFIYFLLFYTIEWKWDNIKLMFLYYMHQYFKFCVNSGRTSKKNMNGRSKSNHDNKKFRTRPMEKQKGMAFGFRKTATAVIKPDGLIV
jgi:hypothetical protein